MNRSAVNPPGAKAAGMTPGRIAAGLYAAPVLVLFLCVADVYLGKQGSLPLPPTVLAVALLGPVVGLLLLAGSIDRGAVSGLTRAYAANGRIVWAFAAVVVVSLVSAFHPTAYWKEEGKWILLNAYGFVIFLCSVGVSRLVFVRRFLDPLLLTALVVLVGSMIYELNYPGYFSTVVSRAAGFPGNANFAALTTVFLAAAALKYDGGSARAKVFDLVVLVVAGFGMFATMSRSGLLNFLLLLALYVRSVYLSGGVSPRRVVSLAAAALVFVGFFAVVIPVVVENTELFAKYKTRFGRFESSEQVDDGSTDTRMTAVELGISHIADAPVLGNGTGFSRTMEHLPHNIYINQWMNNGLPGVVAYVLLLAAAASTFRERRYPKGVTFTACAALGGCFSHNILDQRTFLILLGLLAGCSVGRGRAASRAPLARFRRGGAPALSHSPPPWEGETWEGRAWEGAGGSSDFRTPFPPPRRAAR